MTTPRRRWIVRYTDRAGRIVQNGPFTTKAAATAQALANIAAHGVDQRVINPGSAFGSTDIKAQT